MAASPRDIMAKIFEEIDGLQLIPRSDYDLIRHIPRGYVFALREGDSNLIYIGWSGSTKLSPIITALQRGNPRPLSKFHVLLRDNVHDAREIADYIQKNYTLMHIGGNWYEIDDLQKMKRMFTHVDELVDTETSLPTKTLAITYEPSINCSPPNHSQQDPSRECPL